MGFFTFMVAFHIYQYLMWRSYLKHDPSAWYAKAPRSSYESMHFWPQFLGLMRGPKPKSIEPTRTD